MITPAWQCYALMIMPARHCCALVIKTARRALLGDEQVGGLGVIMPARHCYAPMITPARHCYALMITPARHGYALMITPARQYMWTKGELCRTHISVARRLEGLGSRCTMLALCR